jgi:hypothetical protein
MNTTNPIIPPPELVEQWSDIKPMENAVVQNWVKIATQAAQWGSDQELEACVNYIDNNMSGNKAREFRAIRRPKPPSLKEQALKALTAIEGDFNTVGDRADTIRRALEALDD